MNKYLSHAPYVLDVEMEDGIHRILASKFQEEENGYLFCGIDITNDDGALDTLIIDVRKKVFLYDFNVRISKSALEGYVDLLKSMSPDSIKNDYLMDHPEIKAEINRAKHYDGMKEAYYKQEEDNELEIND